MPPILVAFNPSSQSTKFSANPRKFFSRGRPHPLFTKRHYPTLRDGTTRVSDEISQTHENYQCSNTPKPTIQVRHPTELIIIVEFASRTVLPPLCGETFIPNLFASFLMSLVSALAHGVCEPPIQPRGPHLPLSRSHPLHLSFTLPLPKKTQSC